MRGDKFEKGFRRAPRDLVLMDDVQRVAGLLDMEPRDRAPRPADEIKRPAGAFAQHRRGRERRFDLLDDGLAVIAEFGESQRPERQADTRADRRRRCRIDPHQLDAAAPEIADNAIRIRDAGQHARRRQPSLFAAIDDPHRDPAKRFDLGGERGAVRGFAHRGGCNDREVIDRERPCQRDKALHIGKGERDAVRVEPTGRGNAAAERAHDLFVEERQQRRAEPLVDDKAQRVRADIDDRDPTGHRAVISVGHRRWDYLARRISARQAAAGRA